MKFPGLGDGPCQSVAKTERCSCKRDFSREKLGLPVEDLRLCERPLEVAWEALEVHFLKKRVFCWEAPNTGSAVLDSESCPFPTQGGLATTSLTQDISSVGSQIMVATPNSVQLESKEEFAF